MDDRMGSNINGPSLIRAPDWIENPLGRYYLYFAHHQGTYIRLAYADQLGGPWTTYEAGTLHLEETGFVHHIASPDIHVDDDRREIRMYCHGPVPEGGQRSRVALSNDGLHFACLPEILGGSYFRVFQWEGYHYALTTAGWTYRSVDGRSGFEGGPQVFPRALRHAALDLRGTVLHVYYSNRGDCPERILLSMVDLTVNWTDWQPSEPLTVLQPELEYEGADLPLSASRSGWAPERVRELRDPAIYREGDRTYLLYSVAGEYGLGLAELKF